MKNCFKDWSQSKASSNAHADVSSVTMGLHFSLESYFLHPYHVCEQQRLERELAVTLNGKAVFGPLGFCGSGEKCFLFSGFWGALVIIFKDLGSKLIVLGN